MTPGVCKGCGKRIYWVKTLAGKTMPLDTMPLKFWYNGYGKERIVTVQGEVVPCNLTGQGRPSGVGYKSHFSTCPAAGRYRRK